MCDKERVVKEHNPIVFKSKRRSVFIIMEHIKGNSTLAPNVGLEHTTPRFPHNYANSEVCSINEPRNVIFKFICI